MTKPRYHQMVQIWSLLVLVFFTQTTARMNAVAIFRRDEVDMHKFSAVLAGIEPCRIQLKEDIKRSLNPLKLLYHQLKGTNLEDPNNGLRYTNRNLEMAYQKYETRINDIVRSQNMNVQLFNDMSRKISREPSLKRKILLQTYYYRIAADLESLTTGPIPSLPNGRSLATSTTVVSSPNSHGNSAETQSSSPSSSSSSVGVITVDSEFTRFCRALKTIEAERLKMRDMLQQDLGVKALPDRMCDPDMRPVMCRQVQGACQTFPTVASKVIEYHGLPEERFDALYAKTNRYVKKEGVAEVSPSYYLLIHNTPPPLVT